MTKAAIGSCLLLLALPGCVVGPAYEPPSAMAPKAWSAARDVQTSREELQSFWARFEDPTLTRLINQAMTGNLDIQAADARIRAATAALRAAQSGGLPQIGANAAAEEHRQTQTLDVPPPSPLFGEYPYYAAGFNASWELDLFGETKRRTESAEAAAGGAVEARRGVVVSLTAAVASAYVSFRATEARLQITRDLLRTAQQTQTLAHRAYEAGERSHLDVSQADARVHGIAAAIPPLEAQSENLVHAIAILLGRTPEEFGRGDLPGPAIIPAPPSLPASLPSEVIASRPDIRKAERDYAQSTADVGVSVAALYPHFSIPLSYGVTTSSLHDAFRSASLLWRVGLGASQPLYTGGRLTANLDGAKARRDLALIAYRQTVLRSLAEVEDALTLKISERQRRQSISCRVADDRQAVGEAHSRYANGQIGLLPVLDSERALLASMDAQAASDLANCLATISLYRAMGAGWKAAEREPSARGSTPLDR